MNGRQTRQRTSTKSRRANGQSEIKWQRTTLHTTILKKGLLYTCVDTYQFVPITLKHAGEPSRSKKILHAHTQQNEKKPVHNSTSLVFCRSTCWQQFLLLDTLAYFAHYNVIINIVITVTPIIIEQRESFLLFTCLPLCLKPFLPALYSFFQPWYTYILILSRCSVHLRMSPTRYFLQENIFFQTYKPLLL